MAIIPPSLIGSGVKGRELAPIPENEKLSFFTREVLFDTAVIESYAPGKIYDSTGTNYFVIPTKNIYHSSGIARKAR